MSGARQIGARPLAHHLANRAAAIAVLVVTALLSSAAVAAAAPSSWEGSASAAGGAGGSGTREARGYDISWPQCGGRYPSDPAFGIVGVNHGRVYSTNECLASQILWAGGAAGELYVNTGNPGPELSQFWPLGQTEPRFCDPVDPDTIDCAYDYGWNAAAHSFQVALDAYAALGLPASPIGTTWWLDVETSNSWREDDLGLNVATLHGQVDYFRSVGITRLGFYSTQQQWDQITGGTLDFAAHPSWLAGALSLKGARDRCSRPSFTGSERTFMTQYLHAGFDANLRC